MAESADILVVFGISGDLAKKMTFQSLYRMERREEITCSIVGVAIDEWDDDTLRGHAKESVEAEIDDVTRRLGGGDYPRATAEVGARMRVMGRNSLVVPVDGVDALAEVVRRRVFDEPPQQPFRGHLTVGRSIGKRPISGRSKPGQVLAPIAFAVEEIALVRSTLSPEGARYDTVSTFACR